METSNKLTGEQLSLWTSSAADTPANHSQSPDLAEEKTILDTFGPCSPIAFAWYDPDTHSWRTFQSTLDSDSEPFTQTWPRSGMTRDGIAYQLPPSAPRTYAIAYSLSQGTNGPNGDGLWPTATTADHSTRYAQGGMPLGMAARMWPTPRAAQGDARNHTIYERSTDKPQNLENRLAQVDPTLIGGKLNPTWVEWLMGFPLGWTDLED
jgi:hypothetical protein